MSGIIAQRAAVSLFLCLFVYLSIALLNEIAFSKRLEGTIAVMGSSARLASTLIEKGKAAKAENECKDTFRYCILFCQMERLQSDEIAQFVLAVPKYLSKIELTPAEKQRLEEYMATLEKKRFSLF